MKAIAPLFRRNATFQALVLTALAPGLLLSPVRVGANPSGANVVAGQVNFNGMGTARLDINNLTNRGNGRAIINWQSFSIQRGELTQINQGPGGVTLNRVVSGNPTAIYGRLHAPQGGVVVVNPNGIVVHKGGVIDVAGMMTLSTLDINNKDFLNGGADRFRGTSVAGVRNYGAVSSSDGDVVLLGNFLQNAGSVSAPRGVVAFGAGGDIVVDEAAGAKISVKAGGRGGAVGIDNSGEINAAAAELKAHGNVYALAIQNDGLVRASGYNFSGGRLTLSAGPQGRIVNTGQLVARNSDGAGGRVEISGGRVEIASGRVDAAGEVGRAGGSVSVRGSEVSVAAGAVVDAGGTSGGSVALSATESARVDGAVAAVGNAGAGGRVVVEGRDVAVGNQASVDVSGTTGGGVAQVGGGFQGRDESIRNAESLRIDDGAKIAADATESGRGGTVILWSDYDTLFAGELSARGVSGGGFAEVSGKRGLEFAGDVDVTATGGPAGTLLLDPTNVTISASPASSTNINNVDLATLLDMGTNVIITSNFGAASERGTITVNERVEWYQQNAATSPGTLTFLAVGDVSFNRSVRSAGTGGLNVVAGWDGTTGLLAPLSGSAQTAGGFNMAAVLATMNDGNVGNDAAGLNDGSVFVNDPNGTQFVEVGSRFGATNIAAKDLFVIASNGVGNDRWAQVGFHDSGYEYELGRTLFGTRNEWWGNAAGNVRGKDYIADLGGTVVAGGAFKGAGYGASGAIEIGLSGRLDVRGADNRTRGYAQIGHGGTPDGEATQNNNNRTTRDGFVIAPGDNGRPFFSATWRTNYLGHEARMNAPIKVVADGDIFVSAPRGFEFGFEDISTPDTGSGSFAMIGHGGYRQAASGHGDITVTAHGATPIGSGRGLAGTGVQLRSGGGTGSFAHIGHGTASTFNRRTIWDQQSSGDINVTATTGAVRLIGFNQLPREGTATERNIGDVLNPGTPLGINSSMDPSTLHNHVQIGHGGSPENEPATGGSFTQTNTGLVPNFFNAFDTPFANTGAAVTNLRPDQTISGDINVFAGGTARTRDIMGFDAAGNWVPDPGPGSDPFLFPSGGAIFRDVGVEVRAGNSYQAHGMIGHGGQQMRVDAALSTGQTGDISVIADQGGILFIGGEEKRADRSWGYGYNFVKVGHGGRNVLGQRSGSITVLAGQGAGASSGDLIFRSGRSRNSYAQIGHGGQNTNDPITGDGASNIVVRAKGHVEFTSRVSQPSDITLSPDYVDWALFENGSGSAGNNEQSERVVGTLASGTQIPQSAIQAQNWNTAVKFAMIGHGGNDVNLNGTLSLNNTIEVTAQEGSIRFTAGGGDRDFALIGHGGYRSGGVPGVVGGNIQVDAGGDIHFDASAAGDILIERTSHFGIVERDSGGNIISAGQRNPIGRGFASYAMIGNGGYDMDGDHSGTIQVTAGGDFTMVGPKASQIFNVTGYTGGFIEGPNDFPASGNQNYWFGRRHAQDVLVEASQMQRTFQIYHGNNGASEIEHKGDIVPGTVSIDIASTGGQDLFDFDNGDGTGTLRRGANRAGAAGTTIAYGTINYLTGEVTINTVAVTANNGDLENDRNQVNRNIDYTYVHPLLGNVVIGDERTPESDSALRPNEGFLGHGRIMPGTVSLNIGGTIYTENPALPGTGEFLNNGVIFAILDYDTGRLRFRGFDDGGGGRTTINPTGLPVSASYQWTDGNSDSAFVQLGNGGQGAATGGRDTIGSIGNITLNAGGDVRFHAGAFSNAYALLGNGGTSSQSAHSGDITVDAGGLVEFLGGRSIGFAKANQYAQLGHGGFDADGSHAGNITINAGIGRSSTAPGVIGGGPFAGLIFKGGAGRDTYALLGHGGRSSLAGVVGQADIPAEQAGRVSGTIYANVGGGVTVMAGTALMHPFDNTRNNDDSRNFAQIGHGGWDVDTNAQTPITGLGHTGDITVTARSGNISVIGGDTALGSEGDGYGRFHWAQIGHGGYSTQGDHSGNISVVAEDGGVAVVGGAPTVDVDADKWNWAQIGHGGHNVTGTHGLDGETIKVHALGANSDLTVRAGDGRRSGAMIGNGGYLNAGNHRGDLSLIAGRDLNLTPGAVTPGDDNWAKIGHGDVRNRGGGTWDGDIHISLGRNLNMSKGVIGHIDTKLSPALVSGLVAGNTYIAVSRDNPLNTGTGTFNTTADSVISSAGGGALGDQLRLYMPSSASNNIAAGTTFNGATYARTPAPGSGRADEQPATEHAFPASGPVTEADAVFTPEGDYPFHAFGLYNIYYSGDAPPIPPVPPTQPTAPTAPLPTLPLFDFIPFVFGETYDAFFRYEDLFYYDGYEGMLYSVALEDALEDESDPAAGGWFLEEILDGNVGDRRYALIREDVGIIEEERDEELNRRKFVAARQVGRGGLSYYVFEPGTNRYSSYRVFGVPQSRLSVAQ